PACHRETTQSCEGQRFHSVTNRVYLTCTPGSVGAPGSNPWSDPARRDPKGSRTGNPFGDHVFLGARTAVAYKTKSWGVCGRHLSLETSSKVAIDGPFEAVLGKTRRTEF